jgi:general stress protein 26
MLPQESGGVDLIFHTNTESGKTDDLSADSSVNMSFLNGTGEWASISGKASVVTDRDLVKKYYTPALKTWVGDLGDGTHDGSENDPRIGIIKIEAKTATYAISRGTMAGRAVEMVQGAITGQAAQVNKLREISESEISQYRSQNA